MTFAWQNLNLIDRSHQGDEIGFSKIVVSLATALSLSCGFWNRANFAAKVDMSTSWFALRPYGFTIPYAPMVSRSQVADENAQQVIGIARQSWDILKKPQAYYLTCEYRKTYAISKGCRKSTVRWLCVYRLLYKLTWINPSEKQR